MTTTPNQDNPLAGVDPALLAQAMALLNQNNPTQPTTPPQQPPQQDSKRRKDRKTPTPKNKKNKDSKTAKDLKANLKRAQTYGGHRRYPMIAIGMMAANTILSLAAAALAAGAVHPADITAEVTRQMDAKGASFPTGQAVQWAGQAVRTLYTWDEGAKNDYAAQVAQFLSAGLDAQAGWNGRGRQQVTFVSVNPDPQVIDASHAVVTAAYQITDGSWSCVALPVFAMKPDTFGDNAPWAFTLASLPTPSACTPRTGLPNLPKAPDDGYEEDSETAKTLVDFFQSFFAAWAASDDTTLAQYTADGFTTIGLGGAMVSTPPPTIGEITMMVSDAGGGDQARADVTVTWTRPGGASTLTTVYTVPLTRAGAKWLVAGEPAPAYQATGGSTAPIPAPGASATPVPYDTTQTTSPDTTPTPGGQDTSQPTPTSKQEEQQ